MEDHERMENEKPIIKDITRNVDVTYQKIISGRCLFFTNVPDEFKVHGNLDIGNRLSDSSKEIDCANLVMVTFRDSTTRVIKNRYGRRGTLND